LVSTTPGPSTKPAPRPSRPIRTTDDATVDPTPETALESCSKDAMTLLSKNVTCNLQVTGYSAGGGTVKESREKVEKMAMATPSSALAGALDRVGDRWSLLLVDALMDGPRRFAELQEAVPGIATNVLSQRLRQLEADQVILAVPYSSRPVRYSYSLTESGRGLGGAVRMLTQWSAEHGGGPGETPAHAACGTPLVARWWCPTCEQTSDSEPTSLIWV
jgi:DNA-binding HxlR family transcriptional regulator